MSEESDLSLVVDQALSAVEAHYGPSLEYARKAIALAEAHGHGTPEAVCVATYAQRALSSLPDKIRRWAEHLVTGQVVLRRPKVLLAQSGYSSDVLQEEDGLFVVLDANIVSQVAKTRVKGLQAFTGRVPDLGLPYKERPEWPGPAIPSSADWAWVVAFHAERLRSAVIPAITDLRSSSRRAVEVHRGRSSPRSQSLMVERLAPDIRGTPVVDMAPDLLHSILISDPDALEKLVRFMRRNKRSTVAQRPSTPVLPPSRRPRSQR